jgi:hypothetical protein
VRTYEGELRVVEERPSCAFAFRDDLALFLWGRGITPEEAQLWGKCVRRELAASPRVASVVWLTGLPASTPNDEVRAVIARMIGAAPPSFVGLHYVVEGDGFGSSIARSVVTGLNLMAKPTLPVRVHQSLAEAFVPFAKELAWAPAQVAAIIKGMEALRVDWASRGGTPI